MSYPTATYDFAGAVALVTGGASGIGAQVVRQLQRSGATVAVWDLADPAGSDSAWRVDVSDHGAVQAATAHLMQRLGRIDFVINSAGFAGPTVPVSDYDPAIWRCIVDVNLTGTFNVCRAVVPHLRAAGAGRIVNIASLAGKEGTPNASAYSAAKAGVIALTKGLAAECAPLVRANAVAPSAMHTAFMGGGTGRGGDDGGHDWFTGGNYASAIPLGRLAVPDDVVAPILFLASPGARFITGQTLLVNGGRLMT